MYNIKYFIEYFHTGAFFKERQQHSWAFTSY